MNKLIVLYEDDPLESQHTGTNFSGFGMNAATLSYQVPYNNTHLFHCGGDEILRLQHGKIGVQKEVPEFTVDIAGDLNFSGNLYKNGVLVSLSGAGGGGGVGELVIPSELKTNFIYLGSNNYERNPGVQLDNVHSTFKTTPGW